MEFILMLITFFGLNVAPSDLSEAEIESLQNEYNQTEHVISNDSDGILEIVVTDSGY